jgi:hemin uptake protein HemP
MNTTADEDNSNNSNATSSVAGAKRQVLLADNRLESRELFAGNREITIAHGEEIYRLRLTAQNKLILTK